jgi:hypothetical protein
MPETGLFCNQQQILIPKPICKIQQDIDEISGSHSSKYECDSLLGYCDMQFVKADQYFSVNSLKIRWLEHAERVNNNSRPIFQCEFFENKMA